MVSKQRIFKSSSGKRRVVLPDFLSQMTIWRRLRVCRQIAEKSLLMKADGDARAGRCAKDLTTFRLKSADLSTVYRFVQLK
jgi:hypothetical protein